MSERPVIVFCYPGDWSSVCPDQMGRFEERGAKVLQVSADTPRARRTRSEDRGVEFPLLSDFGREVVEDSGIRHGGGYARRVESSLDDRAEADAVLEGLERVL